MHGTFQPKYSGETSNINKTFKSHSNGSILVSYAQGGFKIQTWRYGTMLFETPAYDSIVECKRHMRDLRLALGYCRKPHKC